VAAPGDRLAFQVRPETPARIRRRPDRRWIGGWRHGAIPGRGRETSCRSVVRRRRDLVRSRDGIHLDEVPRRRRADARLVVRMLGDPRVVRSGGGRPVGHRHGDLAWTVDRPRLPACADLIPDKRCATPVESAVAHVRRHGSPEVPAGTAGGRGATADPAPSSLGLGRPAMRTAPRGHARMVAATTVVVTVHQSVPSHRTGERRPTTS
jgi:hypothetical protein